jgi:hypothetical protein
VASPPSYGHLGAAPNLRRIPAPRGFLSADAPSPIGVRPTFFRLDRPPAGTYLGLTTAALRGRKGQKEEAVTYTPPEVRELGALSSFTLGSQTGGVTPYSKGPITAPDAFTAQSSKFGQPCTTTIGTLGTVSC